MNRTSLHLTGAACVLAAASTWGALYYPEPRRVDVQAIPPHTFVAGFEGLKGAGGGLEVAYCLWGGRLCAWRQALAWGQTCDSAVAQTVAEGEAVRSSGDARGRSPTRASDAPTAVGTPGTSACSAEGTGPTERRTGSGKPRRSRRMKPPTYLRTRGGSTA